MSRFSRPLKNKILRCVPRNFTSVRDIFIDYNQRFESFANNWNKQRDVLQEMTREGMLERTGGYTYRYRRKVDLNTCVCPVPTEQDNG